jgi:hypothetical protein
MRLIALVAVCCSLLLIVFTAPIAIHTHTADAPSRFALSANAATQSQELDPNRLEDPAAYDTRPCVQQPSDANCSGKYPVTPPHVSPTVGVKNGAGACIDQTSKVLENQPITDGNGNTVGTLQLWWSARCSSYFSVLSLSISPSQVSSAEVWVQEESSNGFVQWFDSFSNLPPTVTAQQATGPVAGTDLTNEDLYSPLIFVPSAPTSAHIALQLTDGRAFANFSASFGNGIKQ